MIPIMQHQALMISHKHRCIFVHIPKTAGTSIENVIWPAERTEADLWMGFVAPMRNKYQTGGLQHLTANQISLEVGATIFEEYYKFSFIRNPWDKVISQYMYMRTRPDLRDYIGMPEHATLSLYLDLIAQIDHVQWLPQSIFLDDSQGHSMLDFIGRFESLETDIQHVFGQIGLGSAKLPHDYKSERDRNYRHYFNSRDRNLVARRYEYDIARFKYIF